MNTNSSTKFEPGDIWVCPTSESSTTLAIIVKPNQYVRVIVDGERYEWLPSFSEEFDSNITTNDPQHIVIPSNNLVKLI